MPRPRTHDDALRARLLDVATEELATGGPDALTVRRAASLAGTSTSAVYAFFEGRDGLVRAAGERAADRFADHLRAVPRTEDPGADLLALGLAYRRFALDQPHAYRLMFARPGSGLGHPDAGPVAQAPAFRVLHEAVQAVLAARSPAPDAPGVLRGATALWALAHGLVSLELADQLPVPAADRGAVYRRALVAAGPALLAAAAPDPSPDTA